MTPSLYVAALLFAVSLAGALPPLYRRWSDRGLHLLVSVSAGIFLGTVFLHLLPHLAGMGEGAAGEHGHHAPGQVTVAPWIAALAGLLLLFFVEKVWLRSVTESARADPHTVLWTATYFGLALHSLTTGVALNPILAEPEIRTQFLVSILIHKATETFSLAAVMRLANLGSTRSLVLLALFAALEPIGLLLGQQLLISSSGLDSVVTGFACGTFLYVAVCDLLPEVFHGVDRPIWKIVSVGFGILATALTQPMLASTGQFVARVGHESFIVFLDLAPYLLAGFFIAGILRQVLRPQWLARHFSGNDLKSVVRAALIGAPLPLCSCSVVPVAVSMRRSGASKGATTSFLIATPETGVDSVMVSWVLLDPLLTIARPIGGIVSAIFSGAAVNWFVRRGLDKQPGRPAEPAPADECCASEPGHEGLLAPGALPGSAAPARGRRGWLGRAMHYGFVEMLDDLALSLVVAVVLSGLIAAAVPDEVFRSPLAHGFPGLLLMLVIGIPIYVCATASTPIAAALILKGLSPGAAFVFLLAGPATNLGSLWMLSRHLGRRVVVVQLVALAVITLALGLLVDQLYLRLEIAPRAALGEAAELPGWFSLPCAVLLAVLLVVSIARTSILRGLAEMLRTAAGILPADAKPQRSEGG